MSEYLKGNYELSKKITRVDQSLGDPTEQEFYRRALEKLGGSIAFILKSKHLLWKGDEERVSNGTDGSQNREGSRGSDTSQDR